MPSQTSCFPSGRTLAGPAALLLFVFAMAASAAQVQPYGYEPEKRAISYDSDDYDIVTCESEDRRLKRCSARTTGGVYLERRLSDAPCIYEETWGYDRNGIWVDNGCRAVFRVPEEWDDDPDEDRVLFCASDRNRPETCEADTRWGVRLYRQVSRADCEYGNTWGYNRRGVWVDDGCRGYFVLGEESDEDESVIVRCESDRGRRETCKFDDGLLGYDRDDDYGWAGRDRSRARRRGQARGQDGPRGQRDQQGRYSSPYQVTLLQQLSRGSCELGRSWGHDYRGIWVDEGCRAEFRVSLRSNRYDDRYSDDRYDDDRYDNGHTGDDRYPDARVITCESDDNRRRVCQADTRSGVRLLRQTSRSDCIYGSTWGYDRNGIWVDSGCRGEFQIGR